MDENTDTSLSFLEPLDGGKQITIFRNEIKEIQISPTVIDPEFSDCVVIIPEKIEKLFKSVEKIKFIYRIEMQEYIRINLPKTGKEFNIFIEYFEKFTFPIVSPSNLIFIVGRNAYIANEKNKMMREYKKSVENGTKYRDEGVHKEMRAKYFQYQIEKGINFIYIESGEELHSAIRNISILLQKNRRYLPRVRSYNKEDKKDLMKMVLGRIPGISENILSCLCEKYETIRHLRKALVEEIEVVKNLRIHNEDNTSQRILGDKICNKLKKAFLSSNNQDVI